MPKLILKPQNIVLEISADQPVFAQLKNQGIELNSSCGGFGTCTDCVVKITKGLDHCSPPTYQEIKLLGNIFHLTQERLSCQLKIHGEVEMDITKHLSPKLYKNKSVQKKIAAPKRRKASTNVASEIEAPNNATYDQQKPQSPQSVGKQAGFNRPKRKK